MIRRTVARAFARSLEVEEERPGPPLLRDETPLGRKIHRLYEELHTAFRDAIKRRLRAVPGTEAPYAVSQVQSKPGGMEFTVRTPCGQRRFRNSMRGRIELLVQEGGREPEESLLALHPDEEGKPQLIRKATGQRRGGFEFTSVPDLVNETLGGPERPGG